MRSPALILAAAALLFFTGLGGSTLFDQDEAKYAQVAREILQTGDPITLHVNGRPWFVHPPLYLWLQAATGALFGFTEFTARVWSAIFGVIGVYATFLLGRQVFTPRAALLGAAILASTFQYFAQSRLAVFDGMLVTFMLLAFYAFLRVVIEGERRQAYYAALWAGLGTLTKGPIAVLLPALVAGGFVLLRRGRYHWRAPVAGPVLLYAALAVPWYLVEWARHGWPFVQTVIGYYTVNRFLGVVESQAGPVWYYAPVFGIGAFPWTVFLLAMLPYHLRRVRADGSLIVLLWVVITTAFYTAAGTKLPNYVLPVYPAAALGIGAMWDAAFAREQEARVTLGVAFGATVLALAIFAGEITVFARMKYPADLAAMQQHLVAVALILGIWLLVAPALYAMRQPAASFVMLAATTWILGGILVFRTLPLIDSRRSVKAVAAEVRDRLQPGQLLVGYRISAYQTLLFYTNHPVEWVDDLSQLLALMCSQPRMILATSADEWRGLQAAVPVSNSPAFHPLIMTDDLVALEVTAPPSCRGPVPGR